MLPLKTTIEDFDVLLAFMKTQVGWVPLEKIRKTLPSKATDNRKLEAMRVVGLIERDKTNIKVSEAGWKYIRATDEFAKADVLREQVATVPLYNDTVAWMHHSKKPDPTRTDVANYWHDKHESRLQGAKGAALTDAAVFFLRLLGAAGLGTFVRAGNNRPDTYLKGDATAIQEFVLGAPVPPAAGGTGEARFESLVVDPDAPDPDQHQTPPAHQQTRPAPLTPPPGSAGVTLQTSPAIHVNLEIHIAANATADTVREIFMNMRKYVLNSPKPDDGDE